MRVRLSLLFLSLTAFAAPPEKFLCGYYYPDAHEPADAFKKDCQAWCALVIQGNIPHIPKPPPESTCDLHTMHIGGKLRTKPAWDEFQTKCAQGGYSHCRYNGHGTGYEKEAPATTIARMCLRSNRCEGFTSDSCFGGTPEEIAALTEHLEQDLASGAIAAPKEGERKMVRVHQIFSGTTYAPNQTSIENTVTLFIHQEGGSCKVSTIYQPCSLSFPKETANACYSVGQHYSCQLPGPDRKFVTDPKDAPKQVIGKEVCCNDVAKGKLGYRKCADTGFKEDSTAQITCECALEPCTKVLGTQCTGYAGFPERRPKHFTPRCQMDTGENPVLCCKDPAANREMPYGAVPGIWAPKSTCNEKELPPTPPTLSQSAQENLNHLKNQAGEDRQLVEEFLKILRVDLREQKERGLEIRKNLLRRRQNRKEEEGHSATTSPN